jgi:DNA-binding CsgD family transcriptional regulator
VQRFAQAVRLVSQLGDLDDPALFPVVALPGLAGLVGCDVVTYKEISNSTWSVLRCGFPSGTLDPAAGEVFAQEQDAVPVKVFRPVDQRYFHDPGRYPKFFGRIPIEYQLAMTLSDARTVVAGFAFNRWTTDFTESDRELVAVLREPLLSCLLHCRARRLAQLALSIPDHDDGLASLTDRETDVLELVAAGRTNQAIGHALGVSPRTIAKHLEHTYHKLDVTNRAAAVARLTARP